MSWIRNNPALVGIGVMALVITLLLVGCDDKTPTSASCAFVYGDGSEGNDSKLHRVVYPGQSFKTGDSENDSYVPCNSRNYIVSDGAVKDANGNVIGDRTQLITASTESGVEIQVALTAYWTLNQDEDAMKLFYNVCFKFNCASDDDIAGTANNSTPGWNDMLGENFNPALDRATRLSANKAKDSIWKTRDPNEFQTLANNISAIFADEVRKTVGYQEDLFCGSGNSEWSDPDKPGEGTFTCSPVRIVIDDVRRGAVRADESNQGVIDINTQRLKNAEALYGPGAGYWIALQDLVDKCKANSTICVINLGGASSAPAVPVPVTTPAVPR